MKKIILTALKTIWAIIGIVAFYLLCAYLIPFIEIPANLFLNPKLLMRISSQTVFIPIWWFP
ncbi:MAG TPA: hypothetical protein PKV58_09400 [Kaistella sp.]|nr:hypothetical protein [Kaistella sp.]HPZ26127.1 hypothetical protein [Kaistella sp.]